MIEIRQSEPYSYCQFVMGRDHNRPRKGAPSLADRFGRLGLHAATHWILGIRPGYAG